jgi:hypothetical protein
MKRLDLSLYAVQPGEEVRAPSQFSCPFACPATGMANAVPPIEMRLGENFIGIAGIKRLPLSSPR